MGWQAWITGGATLAMVVAMARNLAGPDLVLIGGLTVLLALGVVTPAEALSGFGNPAVATVAALLVVAAGVRETGGLDFVFRHVLGRPRGLPEAQVRMMLPVSAMSAFLNNTPVVAIMVPIVTDWSKRVGLPLKRLLMPLSYAAILGGTCTLIGTSTNLVVAGMAVQASPPLEIGMFDLAVLGLPALVIGTLYVIMFSSWLLPDESQGAATLENPREYTVAMRVSPDSPVVGQSIEEAGLRQLPGLFLVEIERDGEIIVAVAPHARLHRNDKLLFAGIVDSVVDLRKIRGLVPATNQVEKLAGRPARRLVEAVVSAQSALVGKNVRETRFRTTYNAAIIAVHRQGERIRAKIGDIVLQPGDTLLLETRPTFLRNHRNDGNFALVSEVEGGAPPQHDMAWRAAVILVVMVALSTAGVLPLVTAALLAAAMVVLSGCLSSGEARKALDLRLLIAIAAALGVGAALEHSGAAGGIAQVLVEAAAPFGKAGVYAAIYLVTVLLTETISNAAAAALMFPIAAATAAATGLELRPCALLVMLSASVSLSTPVGYQTNLMVYGPGGYRFSDFVRFGLPLQVVLGCVSVAIACALWA